MVNKVGYSWIRCDYSHFLHQSLSLICKCVFEGGRWVKNPENLSTPHGLWMVTWLSLISSLLFFTHSMPKKCVSYYYSLLITMDMSDSGCALLWESFKGKGFIVPFINDIIKKYIHRTRKGERSERSYI